MKKKVLISLIPVVLLTVLPRVAVFFSGDLAGIWSETAKTVLCQWKTADISLPFYIPVLSFGVWYILQDRRRFKLFAVLYIIIGFFVTLLLTKVNSVPLFTVLKIVLGML